MDEQSLFDTVHTVWLPRYVLVRPHRRAFAFPGRHKIRPALPAAQPFVIESQVLSGAEAILAQAKS
jgi:hypothetical protein